MMGSRVLALWWGINASISKIIGLGVRFGVSPLGISGHANGVPSREINPQTIKALYIDLITAIDIYLESLKTQTYPALKDEACPVVKYISICFIKFVNSSLSYGFAQPRIEDLDPKVPSYCNYSLRILILSWIMGDTIIAF
jgi:hypothetical protein